MLKTSERKTFVTPPQATAPSAPGRPWLRDMGTDGHRADSTQVSESPRWQENNPRGRGVPGRRVGVFGVRAMLGHRGDQRLWGPSQLRHLRHAPRQLKYRRQVAGTAVGPVLSASPSLPAAEQTGACAPSYVCRSKTQPGNVIRNSHTICLLLPSPLNKETPCQTRPAKCP